MTPSSQSRGFALAAAMLIAGALAILPAKAQRVPGADAVESLVKRNLMTFNDANATGNYTVLHARSARQLQARYSPEQLKETFKAFHDRQIDISAVLTQRPVYSAAPAIDNEGILVIDGYFATRPRRVNFRLRLLPAEGDWKILAINVAMPADAEPSETK
jgi:hypothetical protein